MTNLVADATPKKSVSAADVEAITGVESGDEEGSDKSARWHIDGTTPDPRVDHEGLRKIHAELQRLGSEIDEAKQRCDTAAVDRLTDERGKLNEFLQKDTRFGGKPRGMTSETDRLRGTIGDSLKGAYEKLRNSDPSLAELADHFSSNIRAEGPTYIYDPKPVPSWSFDKKSP
jgi:hypothetical protein